MGLCKWHYARLQSPRQADRHEPSWTVNANNQCPACTRARCEGLEVLNLEPLEHPLAA
jgi:hypothetical protein